VCFHCQQSVEKYLKAFLLEHQVAFPKTHSLIELLELCLPLDATFELQRDLMIRLERYAVHYRYPGQSADRDEAKAALNALKLLRRMVQERLGLAETAGDQSSNY
jgi:HEPN domain-containing protein